MTDVLSFQTGRKFLTPEDIFKNATEQGQDKVLIASMREDGTVGVWSSDMSPAELLYMVKTVDALAGDGALAGHNTKKFFDGFIE